MIYDFGKQFDIERAKKRLDSLIERRAVVDITDKSRFTVSQNSYLHVCIGIVALETGVTLEYAKQKYFKRIANREMFYIGKFTDPVTGEECGKWRSTASLTKEEMTLALDRWRDWAARQGWYIPTPEEHAAILQAKIEMEKNKRWL